jgi:hypothetical protein
MIDVPTNSEVATVDNITNDTAINDDKSEEKNTASDQDKRRRREEVEHLSKTKYKVQRKRSWIQTNFS